MKVQNWMSTDTVTVDQDTPVTRLIEILEKNDISHLPVMDGGRVVGIVTAQDLKQVHPSKTSPVKARELYYFLAEMKARDVMKRNPVTVRPQDTVEVAAVKMLEHKVSGIPVVTERGELVGIITQGDVFRVLISITGIYQGGAQLAFSLEDRAGSIKEVADVIREAGGQIVSILSTSDTANVGQRNVFIRIKKLPEEAFQGLIRRLGQEFTLLDVIEDPLRSI